MSILTKAQQKLNRSADQEIDFHILYSTFANNVKYIRMQLGLTQQEFADRFGMNRPKLASIEEGRVLGVENIVMLAKIARVSIDTILLTDMRKVKKPMSEFMLHTT